MIRMPGSVRHGFRNEKEKENRHVSFMERDGIRNKRVNQSERGVRADKRLSKPVQEGA